MKGTVVLVLSQASYHEYVWGQGVKNPCVNLCHSMDLNGHLNFPAA
jgi:hypothetical protein